MKRLFILCFVFGAGAALLAGPHETAILAAMRLSEQPNYSWIATVQDDARIYDIEGKAAKDGLTCVKMPIINSVRRRLGRSVTDTQINVIFRGNVDCVLETDAGWKRPDELPPADEYPQFEPMPSPAALGVPTSGNSITGGIMKGAVIRLPSPSRPPPREERHYSNLQLAVSHPHEELAIIVSSHDDLAVDDDIVTGTLSTLGAQLLLVRDGQKQITPLHASGTFKLWIRDGMVARYTVKLEGILLVDTPNGRRQVAVHQTTNTVVKDIGSTTVEVPEQARRKLVKTISANR